MDVGIYRAEELRRETAQLTHDNAELTAQLESAQCRLMELTIELGQLRDDVTGLSDQLQLKDLANGIQTLMSQIYYTRFPLTSPWTEKLPTCCGLVRDTANKSATSWQQVVVMEFRIRHV